MRARIEGCAACKSETIPPMARNGWCYAGYERWSQDARQNIQGLGVREIQQQKVPADCANWPTADLNELMTLNNFFLIKFT